VTVCQPDGECRLCQAAVIWAGRSGAVIPLTGSPFLNLLELCGEVTRRLRNACRDHRTQSQALDHRIGPQASSRARDSCSSLPTCRLCAASIREPKERATKCGAATKCNGRLKHPPGRQCCGAGPSSPILNTGI
jgi:hypothetical protein